MEYSMKTRFGITIGVLGAALAVWSSQVASATTFTIKNNCGGTITVFVGGANTGNLNSGASKQVTEGTWNGRIQDNMTAGASLTEWNLNASGTDWYDVSYVDGMNDPLGIISSNGASPNTCTKINPCPTAMNGTICESPCTETGSPQFCCAGAYGTSASCNEAGWPAPGSTWVNAIHAQCPGQYSYAYDDNVGLHTTPTGGTFTITFCPAGAASGGSSSTTSSSTTSSTTSGTSGGSGVGNGTYSLYPQCATGSRLDDSAASTANGNKIQIWQANGSGAQNWAFSTTGVNPSGDYNAAVLGPYCLQESGTQNNAPAQLWACNGSNAQSWSISKDASPSGYYQIHPASNGGECLDVTGASGNNGTVVDTYTCNSTNAQQWGGL